MIKVSATTEHVVSQTPRYYPDTVDRQHRIAGDELLLAKLSRWQLLRQTLTGPLPPVSVCPEIDLAAIVNDVETYCFEPRSAGRSAAIGAARSSSGSMLTSPLAASGGGAPSRSQADRAAPGRVIGRARARRDPTQPRARQGNLGAPMTCPWCAIECPPCRERREHELPEYEAWAALPQHQHAPSGTNYVGQ